MIRLLDTNICIYLIRRRPSEVLSRFEGYEIGQIGISSITVAELRYGAEKSAQPSRNLEALSQFLLPLEVADFDADAAAKYGRIRTALERQGVPIGPLDTLIAAHAMSLGTTLVTNNTREFERVPSLALENWVDGESE